MKLTYDYIENITNWWSQLLLKTNNAKITNFCLAKFKTYLSKGLEDINFSSHDELIVNVDGLQFLPAQSALASCLKTAAILAGIIPEDFPTGASMFVNEIYEIIVTTSVNNKHTKLNLVSSLPARSRSIDDILTVSNYIPTLFLTLANDSLKEMKRKYSLDHSLDDSSESSSSYLQSPFGSPIRPMLSWTDDMDGYQTNLFDGAASKGLKRNNFFASPSGKSSETNECSLEGKGEECKIQKQKR